MLEQGTFLAVLALIGGAVAVTDRTPCRLVAGAGLVLGACLLDITAVYVLSWKSRSMVVTILTFALPLFVLSFLVLKLVQSLKVARGSRGQAPG